MDYTLNSQKVRTVKQERGSGDKFVYYLLIGGASLLAILATAYSYYHGYIVAYGDAESHLNIAKRVVDSLTPGFAQLGGIWLPLPHFLLIPFVKFDFLWRTGLAGSIVSGIAYVFSSLFLFRLILLITRNKMASFFGALIFMLNPNILYLQTTPMTELPLLAFSIISTFYFVRFLQSEGIQSLVMAAFFGFCASLSRYDGWFLVLMEGAILIFFYVPWKSIFRRSGVKFKELRERLEGRFILFATPAFLGIVLWLLWDFLILGDPLYFMHSQFSANSQQQGWLSKGELPAYKDWLVSFKYYLFTSGQNIGVILSVLTLIGLAYFVLFGRNRIRFLVVLVLAVPFIFYVVTLYLGQSVIFIPSLTPSYFSWTLFNVRYGVMMVPFAAVFIGCLFYCLPSWGKAVLGILLILQLGSFYTGREKVISLDDGVSGLSSEIAKLPDAQSWISKNYDSGLVLEDDFARTVSIVRTNIPMQNMIYVGNKPYWEESLKAPEKYATWIIMQKNDAIWNSLYEDQATQGRLFKYFMKVYTSPEILIFKRNLDVALE